MNLNAFPMVRIVLPLMFGVSAAAFVLEQAVLTSTATLYLCAVWMVLFFAYAVSHFRLLRSAWHGVLITVLSVLGGALLTLSVSDHLFDGHLGSAGSGSETRSYLVEVIDLPVEKDRSIKMEVVAFDATEPLRGKALLYFEKDSASKRIGYGDRLLIEANLQELEPPANPKEFNYRRYLRFHGIHHRAFVPTGYWEAIERGGGGFFGLLFDIRTHFIKQLQRAGLVEDRLAVASALILGHRAALDPELMQAYAGAGATHVLAVSGLHVGIVYVILNALLRFMDRKRSLRIGRTVIIIVLLVLYAGLTGFSPSVSRATTMFVVVAIGKTFDRKTNIYNTLAVSAFILILWNPLIIMQVGFQLSYAAVLGIVLIQPLLFNSVVITDRKLDWAWKLTCVSVAAQIATFPIGLLYFHQFPLLFMVSNLLVIPAAGLILQLGLLAFVASVWEPTLKFTGFFLDGLIRIVNGGVRMIDGLPNAVLDGIDISVTETLLIYALISASLIFILRKNVHGLVAAQAVAIILAGFQLIEANAQHRQQLLTAYAVRGETAMVMVDGQNACFIGSEKLWNDDQRMQFHIRHHLWSLGIDEERMDFVELTDSMMNREIDWGGAAFMVCNFRTGRGELAKMKDHQLDFAIIHDVSWNQCEALKKLDADRLVVSDQFGPKTSARIDSVLEDQSVHFIKKSGAFQLTPKGCEGKEESLLGFVQR